MLEIPVDLHDGARCAHEETKPLHCKHTHITSTFTLRSLQIKLQTIKQQRTADSPVTPSDNHEQCDAWVLTGGMPKYGLMKLFGIWCGVFVFFQCWKKALEQEIKREYLHCTGGRGDVSRWSRNQNCWSVAGDCRFPVVLNTWFLYGNPTSFSCSLLYLFTELNTHSLWLINAVFKCKSCLMGSSQNHVNKHYIFTVWRIYSAPSTTVFPKSCLGLFQGRMKFISTLCSRSLVWFCI